MVHRESLPFAAMRPSQTGGAATLTLRHCRFIDNENGILGGRGDTAFDIRHCAFARNSLVERPGTHNLFKDRVPCGRFCPSVTVRF